MPRSDRGHRTCARSSGDLVQQETFAASVDRQIAEITANAPLTYALPKKRSWKSKGPKRNACSQRSPRLFRPASQLGLQGKLACV